MFSTSRISSLQNSKFYLLPENHHSGQSSKQTSPLLRNDEHRNSQLDLESFNFPGGSKPRRPQLHGEKRTPVNPGRRRILGSSTTRLHQPRPRPRRHRARRQRLRRRSYHGTPRRTRRVGCSDPVRATGRREPTTVQANRRTLRHQFLQA